MAPVRLAICTSPSELYARRAAVTAASRDANATSLQFGDMFVCVGPEADWARFSGTATGAGLQLTEHSSPIESDRLHLVIQEGRLFQRFHPEVQVHVDRGRYLLVDIDPVAAQRLAKSQAPRFTIVPTKALDTAAKESNRVVFTRHDRGADRPPPSDPDPRVLTYVDRISRSSFEPVLAELVALPTRLSTSAHFQTACDIVENKLASFGYVTSRQQFGVGGSTSSNVIAHRTGTGPAPRRLILVTAHLDSINHEGTDTSPAPGADDDGSGSAGVIEIARALKDRVNVHDLAFIHFGGEEQGLFGSQHFVATLSAAQRASVQAVVNMDMIGTLNTPAPTVLLEGREISRPLLDSLANAATRYTSLAIETSTNAANSDHVSFLDGGIPAVLTIEGADSTNSEVHTARDTMDRINFDLALEILRMNTAFVAEALGDGSGGA